MDETPDLDKLLVDAQANPAAFFARFVTASQRFVYCIAFSRMQNDDDAQDIVQEVFIRVFRGLGQYQPGTKAIAWLVRITLNKIQDEYRRRRPQPPIEMFAGPEGEIGQARIVQDRLADDPPDVCANAELLQRAIEQLTPRELEAYILDQAAMSKSEIAEEMGITESSAHSLVSTARGKVESFFRGLTGEN